MKIVFLNGGLANQVFQYIFYRFACIRHPEEDWFLDDSFFFIHKIHNGYELKKVFGLSPRLLSEFFEPDIWEYMIDQKKNNGKSIPQQLLDNGIEIEMFAETSNYKEFNPFDGIVHSPYDANEFHPEILAEEKTTYYHGYWINREWFYSFRDLFLKELSFPQIIEARNRKYDALIKESESAAIHIRRGDYVTSGIAVDNAVFYEAITIILDQIEDLTLFVFSDDILYCKEHAAEIGLTLPRKVIYVEGNSGDSAYRDMQLMSHCKHMIINTSAFCYLAGLLNQGLQYAVNPTDREL